MPRVSLPAAPASERKHGLHAANRSGSCVSSTVSSAARLARRTSPVGISQSALVGRNPALGLGGSGLQGGRPVLRCRNLFQDRADGLALGLGATDLLGEPIAFGLHALSLRLSLTPRLVEFENLRRLRRQSAPPEALVKGLGLVADPFEVEHGCGGSKSGAPVIEARPPPRPRGAAGPPCPRGCVPGVRPLPPPRPAPRSGATTRRGAVRQP